MEIWGVGGSAKAEFLHRGLRVVEPGARSSFVDGGH